MHLNDLGILGSIYQDLTNYIFALYVYAENPKITISACLCSPTTRTIYLLKKPSCIHICNTLELFQKNKTSLETKLLQQRLLHPYILKKHRYFTYANTYTIHHKHNTNNPPLWHSTYKFIKHHNFFLKITIIIKKIRRNYKYLLSNPYVLINVKILQTSPHTTSTIYFITTKYAK